MTQLAEVNQDYEAIAELDHNESPLADRVYEELYELSENQSYIRNHPNALKMEPNESYIPTSTVEVTRNEAYSAINDGIDVNKNQAYMSVTPADIHKAQFTEYEHVN